MRIHEIITELKFHGSQCTDKCQGHMAGFTWAKKKNVTAPTQCTSHSNSFNNGCAISADLKAKNRGAAGASIRGEKGRFVKFDATKK